MAAIPEVSVYCVEGVEIFPVTKAALELEAKELDPTKKTQSEQLVNDIRRDAEEYDAALARACNHFCPLNPDQTRECYAIKYGAKGTNHIMWEAGCALAYDVAINPNDKALIGLLYGGVPIASTSWKPG